MIIAGIQLICEVECRVFNEIRGWYINITILTGDLHFEPDLVS